MADSTIKGVIKLIKPINVISDKFSVREFVITTQDKYPQHIIFQTVNDKMDIITPYGEGQEVEVFYNVRGREYNGKYYNTLDAYKVQGEVTAPSVLDSILNNEQDDLPF
jgi:Na+-translocating ferredoxin:NAD+ oxidoreductase RnfC subunit